MTRDRFILDVHLAKLARDLRMLGYDALWDSDADDEKLLKVSREENRILLSRDRELISKADPQLSGYVEKLSREEQLVEVLTRFGLIENARSLKGFLTRCLQCNTIILPVQGHQIHHLISGNVLLEHDRFYLCPRCERVYWEGSHFDRMREWVKKTLA